MDSSRHYRISQYLFQAKLTNIGIILIFSVVLQESAKFILYSLNDNIHLKLVIVMIIIPTISNGIQFWITDNFLKKDITNIATDNEQQKKDETLPSFDTRLAIVDDKVIEVKPI